MGTQFEVFISGMSGGSADDWKRAMSAPEAELPHLSEQQRDVARRMGISAKEYARGVLVSRYAEERHVERGKRFGEHIDGPPGIGSVLPADGAGQGRNKAQVGREDRNSTRDKERSNSF